MGRSWRAYDKPAIAQLAEHRTVELCSYQMVHRMGFVRQSTATSRSPDKVKKDSSAWFDSTGADLLQCQLALWGFPTHSVG